MGAEKLIQKCNSYIGLVNKLGKYVKALCDLPPQGEGARKQVSTEITDLFNQLDGQSKSLKNTIISVIYGR